MGRVHPSPPRVVPSSAGARRPAATASGPAIAQRLALAFRRAIAPGLALAWCRALALCLVAAQCLALPAGRADADSMRCGSRIISEGDSIDEVLALCGEPVVKKRTWITRQPRYEYGGQEIPFPGHEDVPVDLWTYDFGSSRLMRRIRFVAGEVDSIETLEHGTER
jgi:hypothetical protein